MKHSILLMTVLSLTAFGASAQTESTDSEEALLFGYCGGYSTSIGSSDASITEEKAAIKIPEDLVEIWDGSYLTQVHIGYGKSSNHDVTVFLTYGLEEEPFYTQDATMTVEAGWNTVVLDTPYLISGESFFVGYSTKVNSTTDKPIGIDNIKTDNPNSAYVNTYNEWEQIGKFYGSVCIRLSLVGDNLPQNSVIVESLSLPSLVEVDKSFNAEFNIFNDGVKTIKSLSVECIIGDQKIENPKVSISGGALKSGESGLVTVSGLQCSETGKNIPVELTVLTVNDVEDVSYHDNSVSSSLNCAEKTYFRQMAVEEFTGTWCGYCPIGLVGMSYMKDTYGDKGFNGIAVHNGDEMQVDSYTEFASIYSQGSYPSALINRSIYILEPSADALTYYYNLVTKDPAVAGLTLTAAYSESTDEVEVTSEVEFSFDEEDADYSLAYVIIEDHMGPYTQSNYFSGGANGYLAGWSDKPSKVENTYYNEVARDIKTPYGIQGSVPTEVKSQQPYSYSTSLSIDNVNKLSNCEVVALLLDGATGEIVNSTKSSISNAEAGIETIDAEINDSRIIVYNPQGVKVLDTKNVSDLNTLARGIYIINGKKVKL